MNFIERAVRVMEDAHEAARHSDAQSSAPIPETPGTGDLEVGNTRPLANAEPAVSTGPVAEVVEPDQITEINEGHLDTGYDNDLDDEAIDRDNVDTYTGAVFRNSTDRIRAAHVRALRAKIDEVEASVDEASVAMPSGTGPADQTVPEIPTLPAAAVVPAVAGVAAVAGAVPATEPDSVTTAKQKAASEPLAEEPQAVDSTDSKAVVPAGPAPAGDSPVTEPVPLATYRQGGGKLSLKSIRAQAYLDPDGREDPLREAFEPMADELLEQMASDASAATPMGRRIMVSSAEPGAGRSLCGVHLALSLVVDHAQTVTYVDMDFNGSPIVPSLGVKPGPGVADWLDGGVKTIDALVVPTELNGLKLIACGTPAAVTRRGLKLDRQSINAFLLAMSSRFPDDLVVLGAPAIVGNSNATILASLAGQVVVVVAADRTPRKTLAEALGALERHSRVSLLLNKMKM